MRVALFVVGLCESVAAFISMKAPTEFVQALLDRDLESAEELLRRTEINLGLNEIGWAALHYLVEEGIFESAEWLLQHGADPNGKDKNGRTPLHWAVDAAADAASQRCVVHGVADFELGLIKLLLTYSASPLAVSNDGQTPISIASDYRRTELVELIETGEHFPRVCWLAPNFPVTRIRSLLSISGARYLSVGHGLNAKAKERSDLDLEKWRTGPKVDDDRCDHLTAGVTTPGKSGNRKSSC